MRVGIVSDTHGLLRPEVAPALVGVAEIIHLGDVGNASILKSLEKIAPVHAVRGNVDRYGRCAELPQTDVLIYQGHYIYLLHNLAELSLDPVAAKFSAVLFGHTHQPLIQHKKGVLYFNPGSCGPRRFSLPVTIGMLTFASGSEVQAEILDLECK